MANKESKNVTIGVKVSASTKKKLEATAKKQDRKISYVVNQIIVKHFNEQ